MPLEADHVFQSTEATPRIDVFASLEFRGEVLRCADVESVPPEGVCVCDGNLYINGKRRGRSVLLRRVHADRVYTDGSCVPVDFIVNATQIDCVLEF